MRTHFIKYRVLCSFVVFLLKSVLIKAILQCQALDLIFISIQQKELPPINVYCESRAQAFLRALLGPLQQRTLILTVPQRPCPLFMNSSETSKPDRVPHLSQSRGRQVQIITKTWETADQHLLFASASQHPLGYLVRTPDKILQYRPLYSIHG